MDLMVKPEISWPDFEKIDMRVGTVLSAEKFPGLRNPAYKLEIDFGKIGIKWSSAQITELYQVQDLIGKQVIAIVNFPKKQIKNFFSECLVMGVYNFDNSVVLLAPSLKVPNGCKIG